MPTGGVKQTHDGLPNKEDEVGHLTVVSPYPSRLNLFHPLLSQTPFERAIEKITPFSGLALASNVSPYAVKLFIESGCTKSGARIWLVIPALLSRAGYSLSPAITLQHLQDIPLIHGVVAVDGSHEDKIPHSGFKEASKTLAVRGRHGRNVNQGEDKMRGELRWFVSPRRRHGMLQITDTRIAVIYRAIWRWRREALCCCMCTCNLYVPAVSIVQQATSYL
ncbi:hypothetical protein J6590_043525 [Homalodisca vitripennis]|nr:hypothetical protein J6590_043525 [Homalodisca vitripennis]